MADSLLFIFWGFGSEYSLMWLQDHAVHMGLRCLHWPDRSNSREDESHVLEEHKICLVCSSHFCRGIDYVQSYFDCTHDWHLPLEIISHRNVIYRVFYPHDLLSPLVLGEREALHVFDLVLWPFNHMGYDINVSYEPVGWPGPSEQDISLVIDAGMTSQSIVWPLSDFAHYYSRLGAEGLAKKFNNILSHQAVYVKLPDWPGVMATEEVFRRSGYRVLSHKLSTSAAIQQSKLVISNANSGITAEALLKGKPVINIVDPEITDESKEFIVGRSPNLLRVSQDDASALLSYDFITHKHSHSSSLLSAARPDAAMNLILKNIASLGYSQHDQ